MNGTTDIWERAKKILAERIDRHHFTVDFRGSYLVDDDGGLIVIDVAHSYAVSALARRYREPILAALAEVGRPNSRVQFRHDLACADGSPDWLVREVAPAAVQG